MNTEAAYAAAVVNACGSRLADDWREDLKPLWPVIHQVATILSLGRVVTHETVQRLIDAELWADEHPPKLRG